MESSRLLMKILQP